MSGFVLLLLIAVIVAFFYTRLRGKMKLPVAGKNWVGAIVVVIIVIAMLWATAHNGGKP